jgi:hypothetical protein
MAWFLNGGEGADLILRQGNVHRVALDPGDGPDRDGDLLPSPEVAALVVRATVVAAPVGVEAPRFWSNAIATF